MISFAVIANHRTVQHRGFRHVRCAGAPDRRAEPVLAAAGRVTPFRTRIRTEDEVQFVEFAMYVVAQAVQLGTFAVMVAVLNRRAWLARDAPRRVTVRGWARSPAAAAGFLIALPCFPLVGTRALAVWALVPTLMDRLLIRTDAIVGK